MSTYCPFYEMDVMQNMDHVLINFPRNLLFTDWPGVSVKQLWPAVPGLHTARQAHLSAEEALEN